VVTVHVLKLSVFQGSRPHKKDPSCSCLPSIKVLHLGLGGARCGQFISSPDKLEDSFARTCFNQVDLVHQHLLLGTPIITLKHQKNKLLVQRF
jgi:hypothetical protein